MRMMIYTLPVFRRDVDVGAFDLLIATQKMLRHRESEALDFFSEMFLREHVDGVLDRVRRDDLAVIRGGVSSGEIASEQRGDIDFLDRVLRSIAQDFHYAHARFAVSIRDQ